MASSESPAILRIRAELALLSQRGSINAEIVAEGEQRYVLYTNLDTSGGQKGLPQVTDVLVTIPTGYPAAQPDMPALQLNSPLAPFVVGGSNPQHTVRVFGKDWRFLSFHPYNGQDGPLWNPNKHGFHDYYQHLYTWLHKV